MDRQTEEFIKTDASVAEMLKSYNRVNPQARITPEEWISLKRQVVELEKVKSQQGELIMNQGIRLSDSAKFCAELQKDLQDLRNELDELKAKN